MSEQAQAQAEQVDDILTNNLDAVDTRNPLLPKGRTKFIIVKVEQKTNAENGKKSINIQQKLNQQGVVSVDNQPLPIGHTCFNSISITPTDKWTKESIQKELKKFQNACGVSGPFHPLAQYEGREVEAEVGISPAKGDYNEANRYKYVDKATGKAQ